MQATSHTAFGERPGGLVLIRRFVTCASRGVVNQFSHCSAAGARRYREALSRKAISARGIYGRGWILALTRNGSSSSVISPGFLPAMGSSRAERGLCPFTERLADLPGMRKGVFLVGLT